MQALYIYNVHEALHEVRWSAREQRIMLYIYIKVISNSNITASGHTNTHNEWHWTDRSHYQYYHSSLFHFVVNIIIFLYQSECTLLRCTQGICVFCVAKFWYMESYFKIKPNAVWFQASYARCTAFCQCSCWPPRLLPPSFSSMSQLRILSSRSKYSVLHVCMHNA